MKDRRQLRPRQEPAAHAVAGRDRSAARRRAGGRSVKERTMKLDPNTIYIGDNGRLFCGALRCAGSTAYASGHDLSGHPVAPLSDAERREFAAHNLTPSCEGCGLKD